MRFRPRRTHEQTVEWGTQAQAEAKEEVQGITGKSIFMEVEGFDLVKDILPEAMHLIDGGFMKNTCGRTFQNGQAPQTRKRYVRASTEVLTSILR